MELAHKILNNINVRFSSKFAPIVIPVFVIDTLSQQTIHAIVCNRHLSFAIWIHVHVDCILVCVLILI